MRQSRRHFLHLAGAGLAAASLAACRVPLAPAPDIPALDYGPMRDGRHLVPAVPIDRIPAWLHRQVVHYPLDTTPGSIVIESNNALLYLVLPDGYALRYGISVGREGLGWSGEAVIYRTAHWPRWTPTPNMIRRDPSLERWAEGQPGGPRNPLGARALYLQTLRTGRDEGIRIHGTPEWRSIGHRASSGCFRMINHDVIDLYGRVGRGTHVSVI